jgi:ABC-type amino acid transport system permease subunit
MSPGFQTLLQAYVTRNPDFVLAANPRSATDLIDRMKTLVQELDAFDAFPEGDSGVVVFALLSLLQQECPDVGEFGRVMQGIVEVTETAGAVLAEEIAAGMNRVPSG